MDIKQELIKVNAKYPLMRTQDYLKLLYQSEFLGGHLINDWQESYLRLQREAETCFEGAFEGETLADDFLDITRVNLRPFVAQNKDLYFLNCIFVTSANQAEGKIENLDVKLDALTELANARKIDLPYFSLKREINEYKSQNYPVLHHSYSYKKNYSPAYRVVKKVYWQLFEAIEEITKKLTCNRNLLIAIEGNSATGKTYFAKALQRYFNCNLISADDFFLPFEMRTEERLQQIGGNIHYERLIPLLEKVKKGEPANYLAFDCHTGGYTPRHVDTNAMTIVEGCYSLHDALKDKYDLALLITANKAVRQRRIFLRDGAEMLQRFTAEWIPREDAFLKNLSIDGIPLLRLDTSQYD